MKNFFIVHKTGKIYFSKNFQGDELDLGLIVGFSSSVSNFCKTLLGEDLREVVSVKGRVLYKEFGDFVFVAHCDLQTGSAIIQAILRDLGYLCEFLFGAKEYWDQDFFELNGVEDIITMFFSKEPSPTIAVGGLNQIYLEPEVRDRLDKLLTYIESQDGVTGSGTMLILGDACLHSRFPLQETRSILQFCKARPLGGASVKYVPVYCQGGWQGLYFVRMQNYVLCILGGIGTVFKGGLEKRVAEFRMAFVQSRLEIPIESPSVLLRLFAKRETLAMLYHNIKTGNTIFPSLRPGPEVQQKEILNSFWNFFSDTSSNLRNPGVSEYLISKDLYKFYARSEGVHKLYLLLSADAISPEQVANEVLKNIKSLTYFEPQ